MTYDKSSIEFNPIPTYPQFKNIQGQTFNRLTAIGYIEHKNQCAFWAFKCICGQIHVANATAVKGGHTKSCGCLKKERTRAAHRTHGESYRANVKKASIEYQTYLAAKKRCNNPNDRRFPDYGGRGIQFCFSSFEDFLLALGRRPSPDHQLDRKDNNGNYTEQNCQWSTRIEQANNKRSNHNITLDGQTHTVAQWRRIFNVPRSRTAMRLLYGWCYTCVFTLPKNMACPHR